MSDPTYGGNDSPVVAEGFGNPTPRREQSRRGGVNSKGKVRKVEQPRCHLCDNHAHRDPHLRSPPSHRNEPKKPPVAAQPEPTSHDYETPSKQESDETTHDNIYTPEEFHVKTYGVAGQLVQRIGIFSYFLFFIFPLAYVAIFFAIIPLGDPSEESIREQWVFLFVSNIGVMIAISYLYNAAFLSLAECKRPFRTSVIPLIAVVVAQIAIMTPINLTNGVFRWCGILALAVCYITLFVSMYFAYKDLRDKLKSFFARFMSLLVLYIPLLSGYIIAYREASGTNELQAALAFIFALVTFIYRRIMLSRLDPFPLDASQLYSGFWVQNLGDCTQILSFPIVSDPKVFGALFFANAFGNVAFLVFVSDMWIFKIRPVLKTYVKEGVKCNFPIPPIPKPDLTFDPHNRGHDNNVGGYRRRQFRFFFFRLLSQSVAMVMYLGISPMLRFGLNEEHNSLGSGTITEDQYQHSMIYAAANFVFICLVGILGYFYLNKRHHQTFHEIREIHRHDIVHHTKVGMVTAIITHNMILTIAIIIRHYCIFAAQSDTCVFGKVED